MGCISSNYQTENIISLSKIDEKYNSKVIISAIVHRKSEDFLSMLEQGLDKNKKFPHLMNRSLVHIAADKGSTKILKILAKKGAFLDEKDSLGMTPLALARMRNDKKTIQLMYLLSTEKEFKFMLSRTAEPSPITPEQEINDFQIEKIRKECSDQI